MCCYCYYTKDPGAVLFWWRERHKKTCSRQQETLLVICACYLFNQSLPKQWKQGTINRLTNKLWWGALWHPALLSSIHFLTGNWSTVLTIVLWNGAITSRGSHRTHPVPRVHPPPLQRSAVFWSLGITGFLKGRRVSFATCMKPASCILKSLFAVVHKTLYLKQTSTYLNTCQKPVNNIKWLFKLRRYNNLGMVRLSASLTFVATFTVFVSWS